MIDAESPVQIISPNSLPSWLRDIHSHALRPNLARLKFLHFKILRFNFLKKETLA